MVQKSSKILGEYSLFLLIDMLFKMLILHAGCHSLIVSYMRTLWFKDFIFAGFSFLVENFKLKGFLKKYIYIKKEKPFLRKPVPGMYWVFTLDGLSCLCTYPGGRIPYTLFFVLGNYFLCLGFREISMLSLVPDVANVS